MGSATAVISSLFLTNYLQANVPPSLVTGERWGHDSAHVYRRFESSPVQSFPHLHRVIQITKVGGVGVHLIIILATKLDAFLATCVRTIRVGKRLHPFDTQAEIFLGVARNNCCVGETHAVVESSGGEHTRTKIEMLNVVQADVQQSSDFDHKFLVVRFDV